MDGSKCILQLRGVRPFLSDKYDITKHPNYKNLSDANKLNAFDIGKYVKRRLVVKPDEEYATDEYEPPEVDLPSEAYGDFQPPEEQEDDTRFDADDLEVV